MLGWLAQLCAACFPQEKWHQLSITIVTRFWHPVKCTTSSSAQSHHHDGCDWILTSCQVHDNILKCTKCDWILTSCQVPIPMMFVTGFWHPVKCINLPRVRMGKNMKYIYQKTSHTGQEKTMWKCFYAVNIKFLLNVTVSCVTCTWHGIMTEWGTNTV